MNPYVYIYVCVHTYACVCVCLYIYMYTHIIHAICIYRPSKREGLGCMLTSQKKASHGRYGAVNCAVPQHAARFPQHGAEASTPLAGQGV